MDSQELRILEFVKGLDIGGAHGGAELFGSNLACALKKSGIDARLCAFYKMDTPAERKCISLLEQCGVEIIFLQSWSGHTSIGSYFAGIQKLARYLREERIPILHSHFQVGTFLGVLLKLSGQVHVLARTAHIYREWERGWEGMIQQIIIRNFIFILFPLLVDLECGVSQMSVNVLDGRLVARWMRKRSPVIYNSIRIPEPIDAQHIADIAGGRKFSNRFLVGSVGRLTEQKGYTYLLNAVPEILKAVPAVEFWVAGEGLLQQDLEEQSRSLGIDQAIHFLGKREDVPTLLDQTDLFVLPSIYEGLPTVVLESISRGVPVVATDIPGTREIIENGQTGWLVPARDPHALAAAIIEAAQAPHLCSQRAMAAFESLEKFSIDTAAQKYALYFKKLL